MGGLFGTPDYVRCCCGCPNAPCDCEFSEPVVCLLGSLIEPTIPDDECAGPRVNGSLHTISDSVKKWVLSEDLAIIVLWDGFNITIPCSLDPLALTGVLVRRAADPSGPSPYVDNEIVQPCEYYFVLYNEVLTSHTIHYEYELCCGQSEAAPPCQTRLSWIRFLNVPAGRGTYDFLFWQPSGPGGNGVLEGECPFADGPNPCLL